MNDMKLTVKFNVGDNVWFFEQNQVKFFEGTINDVQSWDKWSGFRYDVQHISPNGEQMSFNIEEKNLYASKNEILTNLFEENGTAQTPTQGDEAPAA